MLINLRNALMAGKKWKNPYVTDGLVAMWDGEWNAGGGVHNPDATVWTDCMGNGFDLSAASGMGFVTWGANYAQTAANTGLVATGDYVFQDRNITAEVVTDWTIAGNNIGIIAINRGGNYFNQTVGYRCAGGWLFCSYGGGQQNLSITGTLAVSFVSAENDGSVTITAYRAGTALTTKTVTPSSTITGSKVELFGTSASAWGGGVVAKVRAIRLYSRALTASEIAANYAIDKARFGLP